jgi:hypothetical protein
MRNLEKDTSSHPEFRVDARHCTVDQIKGGKEIFHG